MQLDTVRAAPDRQNVRRGNLVFGRRKRTASLVDLIGLFLDGSRAMAKELAPNASPRSARLELYFTFGAVDAACQAEGCDSNTFSEVLDAVFSRYTGRPSFEGRLQSSREFSELLFDQGDRSPTLRAVVELGAHAIRDFVTREGELPLGRLSLLLGQSDDLLSKIDRELTR